MLDSDRFRKVAVLVDSLDAARADALLEQMPETQRAMIRNLVVALEDVTDSEREQVIADFIGPGESPATTKTSSHRGVETHDRLSSHESDFLGNPLPSGNSKIASPGAGDANASETVQYETDLQGMSQYTSEGAADTRGQSQSAAGQTGSGADNDSTVWFESSREARHDSTGFVRDEVAGNAEPSRDSFTEFQETTIGPPADGADAATPYAERTSGIVASSNHVGRQGEPSYQAFGFVREQDAPRLVRCIEFERPQIIARVISSLCPKLASSVVALLSDDVRREVLRRLPSLRDSEPEIIHELERCVWGRFNQMDEAESDLHSSGFKSLEAILDAAEGVEQINMIESLIRERPDLRTYLAERFDLDKMKQAVEESAADRTMDAHDAMIPFPGSLEKAETAVVPSSELPTAELSEAGNPLRSTSNHVATKESSTAETPLAGSFANAEYATEDGAVTLELSSHRGGDSFDEHETETQVGAATDLESNRVEKRRDNLNGSGKPTSGIAFDSLMRLDDQSLSNLLGHAEPKLLLIALAGAQPKLIDKLLRQIPRKEAKQVKKRIDQIGPIRLQDIQHAQNELTTLAIELTHRGLISERSLDAVLNAA